MFSQKDEHRLLEISETYQDDPKKELETRFYIDDETTMERIYKQLLKESSSARIEQVLNTLSDAGKNMTDRKEIWFKNGSKTNESSMRKHREKNLVLRSLINIQIAVSSEIQIPPFSTSKAKQIRLKLRSSLVFGKNHPLENWRADFTIVRTIGPGQFQNIINIKDEFFGQNTTTTNFTDIFKDNELELELECVGLLNDANELSKNIKRSVQYIFEILDPEWGSSSEYQQIIGDIATLVLPDKKLIDDFRRGQKTLKQLANQPQTFDFNDYREMDLSDYWLSDKADGERCFAYFKDESLMIVTTTKVHTFPLSKPINMIAVLDCEVLLKKSGDPQLFAFDILYYNRVTTQPNTNERFEILQKAVKELSTVYKQLDLKIQVKLTNPSKQIMEMWKRKTIYPIDGLVFTPATKSNRKRFKTPHHYYDMIVYKWKPPERQTIDFLVMQCPKNLLGIDPYMPKKGKTLYFLFNGISPPQFKQLGLEHQRGYKEMFDDSDKFNFRPDFFPVAFQPSSNKYAYICYVNDSVKNLDGHVAEFGWDFKSEDPNAWQFHGLRPDRDTQVLKGLGFGNSFKVAEIIYNGYKDPFTLDHLINPTKYTGTVYFSQTKEEIYKPLTKFNAFGKAQVMRQLEDSKEVIDLAGGKGQDLFTLHGLGIEHLLMVDIDKEAVSQINKRKYNLGQKQHYLFGYKPNPKFQLTTKVLDLTKPADQLINAIPMKKGTVDGIIMNFAIHYIVSDQPSLDNLIDFIDHMLRSKGLFIFTCFDGERVFDFLKATKQNESMDLMIDDPRAPDGQRAKYSIKKLYSDKKFKPNGLKISAIHPFSQGEYYKENLLDLRWVMTSFKKRNYTVLQYGSFGDWLDRFAKANPTWASKMSDHDKLYASLYSYVTVVKH